MRGIENRQEINPQLLLRDTRTIGQKIHDFFENPSYVTILLVALGCIAFLAPSIADLMLIIGISTFFYTYTRKLTLPFRLPQRANVKDFNDLKPSSTKPNMARGIAFFGNDINTNEELWFNNEDMRTHVLIFGSTGSGKTEALVSLAYNSLVQGSGFIYVDGKGDNSLYAKIFSMVRTMGREDDLLLVNFMTGARDIVGPQERRLSNTLNPFAIGSSSMLAQLVVSLMDSSSQSPDGDMWKGRAISFVEALMKILVYMRDAGHLLLDANAVRNYFLLPRIEAMVMDKQFIRDNAEPVSLEGVPDVVLEPLNNYLFNLPGYNKEKKGKQVSQVLEQHGFITMQLTRVFTSLADTYGHIMRTKLAEVDFKDVVLNRRILVVLLPALEKSPDELSNLGKVIVSSLKAMMASGLGEEVEGEYEEIIQRKPTNAPTPYLCILDEYGYYAVQGFAVVPAQARSLGFSAIFAGQDLPAFQKASKEEAASIGANTNIKICMKLEDPTETWEFFTKTAGEAYVTKVDAFSTRENSVTNAYMDTRSASFEKRARIDLLDLKDQGLGEAHIFFRSKIIRARMFYANPSPVKRMRINQFVKVEPPPTRMLIEIENQLAKFQDMVKSGDYSYETPGSNEDIEFITHALREQQNVEPIERGVNTLIAFHDRTHETVEEITEVVEELSQDELNIFTTLRLPNDLRQVIITSDLEQFSTPLLSRTNTRTYINNMERISGRTERHATSIANEIIKDMEVATMYPPEHRDNITTSELVGVTHDVIARIQNARQKAQQNKSSDS
ncbi:MAG: type IVB secretion system protein IcmO/DotL [Gammaproteobacteria bacterium]